MIAQNIPAELKARKNWVVWKEETRNGKQTKPPFDAKQNGKHVYAETNNADTWASFDCAVDASDVLRGQYEGAGFVFTDTEYVGVDLDGVVHEDETIDPFAIEILKLANTYSEFSPSGTGVHLIFESSLPLPVGNRKGNKKLGGEIYNKTSPRFFTVTGHKTALSADTITKIDDPEKIALLHFMVMNLHDTKLTRLWVGDTSAYDNDDSKADLALCGLLARALANDASRIEKYFGASVRGQRDKWTQRKDYRDRTIAKAISGKEPQSQKAYSESENSPPKESVASGIVFHLPAATGGTHKDWVFEPSPGVYEGLFPRGAVSIVAGTSGVGKTTLMAQMLLAQRAKAPFFNHSASVGYPFVVLGADRGIQDLMRTMESMHLPMDAFPFERFSLTVFDRKAVQVITSIIETLSPIPEIIFIEGLDFVVTNESDKHIVASFMDGLQTVATHYHLAIIGSNGSPKSKEGQSYNITRENISGSGAWGRAAATVVTMQFPNGDDSAGKRIVRVLPRRGKPEKFTMEFQDGMLVVVPNDPEPNEAEAKGENLSKQVAEEIEWYQEMARAGKTDPTKRWWTVQDQERKFGQSPATADRHVKDALTKGFIILKPGKKIRKGGANQYQWNQSTANSEWVEHPVDDLDL